MGREKRYSLDSDVPLWKIPAGVCDACGRYSWMMHLTGAPCAWCHLGVYIHRGEFEWAWRHCGWRDPFCATCYGKGVIPKQRISAHP